MALRDDFILQISDFKLAKILVPCLKHAGTRADAGRHKMHKRQQKMSKKGLFLAIPEKADIQYV